MEIRTNTTRLKVDLRFNRLLIGRFRVRTGQFEILETFRFERRTKSIELLASLADGEWIDWDNSSSQRAMVRWIERTLAMINKKHNSNFRLEFRTLHSQLKAQIGLIGG